MKPVFLHGQYFKDNCWSKEPGIPVKLSLQMAKMQGNQMSLHHVTSVLSFQLRNNWNLNP